MATLTPEQTDFLKSHHIPMDKTFDASGLSGKAYKAKMIEGGTLVAYGVTPCDKGHTLRNKQGNCLQCSPHAIASIKRQAVAGHLYIAASPSQGLLKISATEDASDIAEQLNAEQHAGINDWQSVLVGEVDSLGQAENQLQQLLSEHQIPKKLTATAKTTKASQIYRMDIDEAIDRLNALKFRLSTVNTPAIEAFHQAYSERVAAEQAEQARIAQQKSAEQAAQQQAEAEAQQQAADAQRQAQEQLRLAKEQQKLAQKQQRDATKQQKQSQSSKTAKTPNPSMTQNQAMVKSGKPLPVWGGLSDTHRRIVVVLTAIAILAVVWVLFALRQ